MRILQLIDSLEMGGAEKMAVQYANGLAKHVAFSGLVVTRREGGLKSLIDKGVVYEFLKKGSTVDFRAILKLQAYCKTHRIEFIHAHGTSYFMATIVKLLMPGIKIIWHDHNGNRGNQSVRHNKMLWLCARMFDRIIVVNQDLLTWSRSKLGVDKLLYLPNFAVTQPAIGTTILSGIPGKRILCLANLRHPKNHMLLLEVAQRLCTTHPGWTFHFVGDDRGDGYSDQLKQYIKSHQLQESVYLYGLRTDISHIIHQAEIAVLASRYEGLPVSLLEYGLYGKAVVATAVGEIPAIVNNGISGLLVEPEVDSFYNALNCLIGNEAFRMELGAALKETILAHYSEDAVIGNYIQWIDWND